MNESHRRRMWEYFEAWDEAQANDHALFEGDPDKDKLNEAGLIASADPANGFQQLLALAEQGSVPAMAAAGFGYLHGLKVEADAALGEYWHRRAAEGGSQYAQLELGKRLGARRDFAGCEAIFAIGVSQNWAPAKFWLAWYRLRRSRTRTTYREVQPLLEQAAAQGSPAAKWVLGKHLCRGDFGIRHIPRGIRMMLALGGEMAPATMVSG